jgi:hypothetical protein
MLFLSNSRPERVMSRVGCRSAMVREGDQQESRLHASSQRRIFWIPKGFVDRVSGRFRFLPGRFWIVFAVHFSLQDILGKPLTALRCGICHGCFRPAVRGSPKRYSLIWVTHTCAPVPFRFSETGSRHLWGTLELVLQACPHADRSVPA